MSVPWAPGAGCSRPLRSAKLVGRHGAAADERSCDEILMECSRDPTRNTGRGRVNKSPAQGAIVDLAPRDEPLAFHCNAKWRRL